MRVAFVHPDLGLGGAERLIVDAAVELVAHRHHVDVYTAYYDPNRCFEETKTAGFRVLVAGNWFPRHVFKRLTALCACIRCLLVALYLAWTARAKQNSYDVIIVDQVSAVVPLLHLLTRSKVLFYCHFPDMLLSQRKSFVKKVYRAPLDWLEQTTTGQSDMVLVNSKFTAATFAQTFTRLASRGICPEVLYPAVAVPSQAQLDDADKSWKDKLGAELSAWISEGPLIVSINRFERKKGLPLAILALHELLQSSTSAAGSSAVQGDHVSSARLLMAGGWDARLAENVEHLEELKTMVKDLGLEERVKFLPSFTDAQRSALLAACKAVVYTPQFEHFGIVPLESMASCRPVIAVNNGGPLESVLHGQTGLLCEPTPAAFAAAYKTVLSDAQAAETMGVSARKRVIDKFSRTAFGAALDAYVQDLVKINE